MTNEYDLVMTASDLFYRHAPDFNFEHGEEEIVELGLERDVIHSVGTNDKGEPVYKYNPEWLEAR